MTDVAKCDTFYECGTILQFEKEKKIVVCFPYMYVNEGMVLFNSSSGA